MGFKTGRKKGMLWEDALQLDSVIRDFPFNTTGKNEREFETGFATTLMAMKSLFKSDIITQIDKSTTVQSVFCFGKKHRPDLSFEISNSLGVAVEIKFVNYAGLKEAIGQGIFYRLRYKFVFLIIVISEKRKSIYEGIDIGKEKDLEDILSYLATNMNIFTYIVPAFNIKPGTRKCIHFFQH